MPKAFIPLDPIPHVTKVPLESRNQSSGINLRRM